MLGSKDILPPDAYGLFRTPCFHNPKNINLGRSFNCSADKSAQGAISQIEERKYTGALDGYEGNLLLVGINYNRKDKKHECVIKQFCK